MKLIKPTTAQTVAVHTLESAGASVLITVVVGIGQVLATNGLNLPVLGVAAGTIFLGAMSMVYKSLATNPQIAAGAADTVNEVRAAIQADIQVLTQRLTGGQAIPTPQLLQAPASLDAASVADTILQHLDLSPLVPSLAQNMAQELMKVRMPQQVPAVQPQTVPQRPTASPTFAPPQQPFQAG